MSDLHQHNDWLCPAHTCAPAGTAEACPGDRDAKACNPYWNGCPDGFELDWEPGPGGMKGARIG